MTWITFGTAPDPAAARELLFEAASSMQRLFRPQTPCPDGRTDLVLLPSWEVGFDGQGRVGCARTSGPG